MYIALKFCFYFAPNLCCVSVLPEEIMKCKSDVHVCSFSLGSSCNYILSDQNSAKQCLAVAYEGVSFLETLAILTDLAECSILSEIKFRHRTIEILY